MKVVAIVVAKGDTCTNIDAVDVVDARKERNIPTTRVVVCMDAERGINTAKLK